jgi:hypothetical protein
MACAKIGIRAGGKYAKGVVPGQGLDYAKGTAAVRGPAGNDAVHGVSLTKGEAVLPVNTVKAIGAKNIAKLIQSTNGKSPRLGVHAGGKFASGAVPDPTDPAYQAGQATRQLIGQVPSVVNAATDASPVSAVGKALQPYGEMMAKPIEYAVPAVESGLATAGQFGRGLLGLGIGKPTPAPAPAPTPAPAPAPTPAPAPAPTPAPAPAQNAPKPGTDGAVTAGVIPPAVRAPSAATAEPNVGVSGAGFIKNDKGEVVANFQPSAPTAPETTPFRNAAGYDPQLDRIVQARKEASTASAQQTALQGAQQSEVEQKTAEAKQVHDIQTEMMQPGITAARKAQLAEVMHGLRGSGDLWMPYQAKDAMGMPTGEASMYNRATGEVRAMPKAGDANASRPVGTTSTVNGKTAKWDGKQWVPQ